MAHSAPSLSSCIAFYFGFLFHTTTLPITHLQSTGSPVLDSTMLGLIWSLLTTYRPNAASERNRRAQRYGAFAPTYYTKIWRRPKNDREAQK